MIVLVDSVAIVCLILGWWVAITSYPRLPASIPVYVGLTGEADGWGGRWMIFLMAATATLIFAIDWFLFWWLSGSTKMSAAMALPLHTLLLELATLFTFITWEMSEVAFGRAKRLGGWFLLIMALAILSTSAWMIVAAKAH